MKSKLLLTIAAMGLSFDIAAEQACYNGADTTTPIDQFTINTDGTVSDSKTGLMWQRCSYGQIYNSETGACDGSTPSLTWQEALRGALNDTTADYDDWQVPNIKELASILEHSCTEPSINEDVFFGTKLQNYWSNTSGVSTMSSAWVYQFDSGLNSLHAKTSSVYLRLMRYEK
jgi:outer membrane receptor for monomeric catechols